MPSAKIERNLKLIAANVQQTIPRLIPEIGFFSALQEIDDDWKPILKTPPRSEQYFLSNISKAKISRYAVKDITSIQEEGIIIQKVFAQCGFYLKSSELSATNVKSRVLYSQISDLCKDIRKQLHDIIYSAENEVGLRKSAAITGGAKGKYLAAYKEIDDNNAEDYRAIFLPAEMKWNLINQNSQITKDQRFICTKPRDIKRGKWEAGKGTNRDVALKRITRYAARARYCAGLSYVDNSARTRPAISADGSEVLKQAVKEAFNDVLFYLKGSSEDAPSNQQRNSTKLACIATDTIIQDIKSGKFAYEITFNKKITAFGTTSPFTEANLSDIKTQAAYAQNAAEERNKTSATADNSLYAIVYTVAMRLDGSITTDSALTSAVAVLLQTNNGVDATTANTLAARAVADISATDYPKVSSWPTLTHQPFVRLEQVKIPNLDSAEDRGAFFLKAKIEGLGIAKGQINQGDYFEFEDYYYADSGGRIVSPPKAALFKVVSINRITNGLLGSSYDITFAPFANPCGNDKTVDRILRPYMRINSSDAARSRESNRSFGAICSPYGLLLINLTRKSDYIENESTELTVDASGVNFLIGQKYDTQTDVIDFTISTTLGVAFLDPGGIVVFSHSTA